MKEKTELQLGMARQKNDRERDKEQRNATEDTKKFSDSFSLQNFDEEQQKR
jgi:hypothetical protein